MHPLLQQLQNYSQEAQLRVLLMAQRTMKHQMALLSQLKLAYIERGQLDSWQHEYAAFQHNNAAIEMAIQELAPAPALPAWMPRALPH